MNPYNNYYTPPYMQQPVQQLTQHVEPKVIPYIVDSVEQLYALQPMPNTVYLGIARDGSKMFQRRMNNDGLMEVKTFSLADEQTKKTDMREILDRLSNIEKKLGVIDESNVIDVA